MLPAYAGMIRLAAGISTPKPRAPRVCGDDPPLPLAVSRWGLCSPRMRG